MTLATLKNGVMTLDLAKAWFYYPRHLGRAAMSERFPIGYGYTASLHIPKDVPDWTRDGAAFGFNIYNTKGTRVLGWKNYVLNGGEMKRWFAGANLVIPGSFRPLHTWSRDGSAIIWKKWPKTINDFGEVETGSGWGMFMFKVSFKAPDAKPTSTSCTTANFNLTTQMVHVSGDGSNAQLDRIAKSKGKKFKLTIFAGVPKSIQNSKSAIRPNQFPDQAAYILWTQQNLNRSFRKCPRDGYYYDLFRSAKLEDITPTEKPPAPPPAPPGPEGPLPPEAPPGEEYPPGPAPELPPEEGAQKQQDTGYRYAAAVGVAAIILTSWYRRKNR